MIKSVWKIVPFLFVCSAAFGQLSGVQVKVIDRVSNHPLPSVNVQVYQDSKEVIRTQTNNNGVAEVAPLDAGTYDLKVTYQQYYTLLVKGVRVSEDSLSNMSLEMVQNEEAVNPT